MSARQIQIRRGSAADHEGFTGAVGEVTYVTDLKELRTHDGETPGGNPVYPSVDLDDLGGSPRVREINSQSGTTYTFDLTDNGKLVLFTSGSAVTATVPPNDSKAFEVGTQIDVAQMGAGQVTLAAGSGVTIRSEDSKLKLSKQYSGGTLVKLDTNEWLLVGSLAS